MSSIRVRRDNREKGVSASETPFSLFCRDNFSENMVSVCVCHFLIVSYTKDGKRIDSVIFSGHGCISNQDGKFAPNWHADMPLTLEEGTLTSNGEIRRIGHFAGWDMLSAPINIVVSEVSNISDTKFAVENAL